MDPGLRRGDGSGGAFNGYERWVLWVEDSGKVRKIFMLDGNAKVINTIDPYSEVINGAI
jgi:hypothetical protein